MRINACHHVLANIIAHRKKQPAVSKQAKPRLIKMCKYLLSKISVQYSHPMHTLR